MLSRMSSREFSEWMIYYELEPFGEERADLRQAMTTSAVHNNLQAKAKNPKYTKPTDFMLFSKNEDEQVDTVEPVPSEELRKKFMAFAGKK